MPDPEKNAADSEQKNVAGSARPPASRSSVGSGGSSSCPRKASSPSLLGEALAGESPAALQRLTLEDQRQAEERLVALTSNGKTYYKLVE